MIFTDLENTYDRVSKEVLRKFLEKKEVRIPRFEKSKILYDRITISARTQGWITEDFPISIGLHDLNSNSIPFYLGLGCAY